MGNKHGEVSYVNVICLTLYLSFRNRTSPEFQKLLGIAMEMFLLCSDDSESDVRMVADECLNKIIKVSEIIQGFFQCSFKFNAELLNCFGRLISWQQTNSCCFNNNNNNNNNYTFYLKVPFRTHKDTLQINEIQ